MPPAAGCPTTGPPSPEVTGAFCRVPSTSFSQAPWYALPVHLCRFRVRSDGGLFPGTSEQPFQSHKEELPSRSVTSSWPRNINVVPIAYAFRPRLRGRLTLLRLALSRNPWTFGESVSHTLYRYSCQHSHFSYVHHLSLVWLHPHRERSATPCTRRCTAEASVHRLSPVTFSARGSLFRPVSCYAFFKGWLLLSQPPGCFGIPTCFPT